MYHHPEACFMGLDGPLTAVIFSIYFTRKFSSTCNFTHKHVFLTWRRSELSIHPYRHPTCIRLPGDIKFYPLRNYSVWRSDRAGSRCVITDKSNDKLKSRRTDTPAGTFIVLLSALSNIAPNTLSTLKSNVKCPVHVMEA